MTNIRKNIENILDRNIYIVYRTHNAYAEKAVFEIEAYLAKEKEKNPDLDFIVSSAVNASDTRGVAMINWVGEDNLIESIAISYLTPLHPKAIELGGKD